MHSVKKSPVHYALAQALLYYLVGGRIALFVSQCLEVDVFFCWMHGQILGEVGDFLE